MTEGGRDWDHNYEELEDDEIEEFHHKLCTLIEKKAKGDIEKAYELVMATDEFADGWMDTYSATGALWHLQKPAEWRCQVCGKYHEAMAPMTAEVNDEYDGECPHCDFEGKLTVTNIL